MKININRFVVLKNDERHNLVQLRKTFSKEELFCIPRVGDIWEETTFSDKAATVEQVVFNHEEKECNVFLTNLQLNENSLVKELFERSTDSLKKKGWKIEIIEPTLETLLK